MARGVWVQALSTDGSLKFNRYLWNVQDKVKFDYVTGRSKIDRNWRVPEVSDQKSSYNHYQRHNDYRKKY